MDQLSCPGVYFQEIVSGIHATISVATSTTAFIDSFEPANKAGSYAILRFFLNGGGHSGCGETAQPFPGNHRRRVRRVRIDQIGCGERRTNPFSASSRPIKAHGATIRASRGRNLSSTPSRFGPSR
jgi:hypothetical protein